MEQALVKKELTQLEKDILSVIETSEIQSAAMIANLLECDESEVIAVLNNDEFYNLVCANSLSNMRLAYHSKAIPKLINKLDNEKEFFDAYDRIVKTIGAVKERDNEGMKVSLEVLVKEKHVPNEVKDITPKENKGKENEEFLNTVSKVSGNVFGIEEDQRQSQVSPRIKPKIEIDYEWEE